ncbi:MAG: hypothetical protein WKF83_05660 [Nocardioidaceae bacterium]
MAPMAHQGKYPYYIQQVLMDLAVKHGGPEVAYAIDSLEPGAWKHESMKMAAEALLEIKSKGYMLEGTEGLDHIQSQTQLERAQGRLHPLRFVVGERAEERRTRRASRRRSRRLRCSTGAALPFDCTRVEAAEAFVVPAEGCQPGRWPGVPADHACPRRERRSSPS